jgi:hypothetical protein
MQCEIGDEVMYAGKFLGTIGDYSKESADARFTVISVQPHPNGKTQYVRLRDKHGDESGATSANLEKAVPHGEII